MDYCHHCDTEHFAYHCPSEGPLPAPVQVATFGEALVTDGRYYDDPVLRNTLTGQEWGIFATFAEIMTAAVGIGLDGLVDGYTPDFVFALGEAFDGTHCA